MFFMIGTWPGSKDLGYHNGYHVTMTYNALVIFFIPVWKFDKHYLAERCGRTYELDPETGKKIERGEEVTFHFADEYGSRRYTLNRCPKCGYTTSDLSFEYCPRCATKLEN